MDQHKLLGTGVTSGLLIVALLLGFGKGYAVHPYDYLLDFCSIGERVPGTAGHKEARDFIVRNL